MTQWVFLSDYCEARGVSRSRDSQERSFSGCDLLMARIRHPKTRRLAMAVDADAVIRWLDSFLADGLDPLVADEIMARSFEFGGADA